MTGRPTIAFVDRDPASGFMAVDLELLSSAFDVVRLVYPGRPTVRWVFDCLAATRRCDAAYAFFASEHALVPALVFAARRKAFVLVPAGYDYANVAERRYGLAARGLGWLPRLIGRLADVALPISWQTLWEFVALVPSAAPRTRIGYLAVDETRWQDPGVSRDADRVVTLAYVDEEAWSRKGVDRFVELARRDPDREYVLAGRVAPESAHRLADAPSNLVVTGHLSHDELVRLFWSAGVYAQLSWHETFGVAMAEAMLCGCVPLVSDSPALNEVAGQWAVRPEHDDPAADLDALDRAVKRGAEIERAEMRADIAGRFSMDARRELLVDAFDRALR